MAAVDISVLGSKELQAKLSALADKAQKKIVRQAVRASAKRAREEIVHNIQRNSLVDTGNLLSAFRRAGIRQASKYRGLIRLGPEWPSRAELGIRADDKYYYPTALEFGHPGAPAIPFIRPAIDERRQQEIATLARDIGAGIEREAAKGGSGG